MADVVSDLVLSFFCCCFYAPGDLRGVGGAHHYGGGHAHPAGLPPRRRRPGQARVPAGAR